MEQQVRDIFERRFPGAVVDVETMQSGRVTGMLVWAGFADENMVDEDGYNDQVTRQQTVRRVLREELGPESQYVGVLLTYTPDEVDSMTAA